MTQKERVEVKQLTNRFDEMTDEMTEIKSDIKHILFLLQDDVHTNSKGLVSRVNNISSEVYKLRNFNRQLKGVLGVMGALIMMIIGNFVKNWFQ